RGLAEAAAPAFGISTDEALESGVALVGTVDEGCDLLVQRREEWGVSYIALGDDQYEAFAPVVARLARARPCGSLSSAAGELSGASMASRRCGRAMRTHRFHRLRRTAGTHCPAAGAVRRPGGLADRARVRGRGRRLQSVAGPRFDATGDHLRLARRRPVRRDR